MSQARERLDELCAAAWAVGAAAAWAEDGAPPELVEPVRDVLEAAGLWPGLEEEPRDLLRADLRATLLQMADLAARAREGTLARGWPHTDPVLLQAQGDMSAGAVPMLVDRLFPMLGLQPRDFIVVGAGVASVSIGLCRRLPELRAVAIEPQDAPLELARRNVDEAGLGDRIELRRQLVQEIADEEAFDVVWLPITFLPRDVVETALSVLLRALRPGGVIVTGTLVHSGADLGAAAARLRAALWGGDQLTPDDVERMARDAGYTDVQRGPQAGSGLTPMFLRR